MTRNRTGHLAAPVLTAAAALSALAFAPAASAQCEVDKFCGASIHQQDQFAFSLAADGYTAISGAYKADSEGGESGTAFVFTYDGQQWNQEAELSAFDGAPFDHLGFDVALHEAGLVALAGAPDEGSGANKPGAAYVFFHSPEGWVPSKKLVALDGAHGDRFGAAVAVYDTLAVVGAPEKSGGGAVYLFRRVGGSWFQVQKLTAFDATSGAQFGFDVSFDGTTIAIGARRWDSPSTTGVGKVYLYAFNGTGWALEDAVTSNDGLQGDFFGSAVSVDGARLVVGAPNDDDQGFGTNSNTGVGFHFVRSGSDWNFVEKFLPPATSHGFSTSLELDGDYLMVGAFLDKQIGMDAGAGHVFELVSGSFDHLYKIITSDHEAFDELGGAVALSGDLALISADFDDDSGWNAGAAYSFSVEERNCRPLYAWPDAISLAAGGSQAWTLDAGAAFGGYIYWVLGSLTESGGFNYDNAFIPLTVDPYFFITLNSANSPTLPGSLGTLDPSGSASAGFALPAATDPGLAGIELFHAFVLYEPVLITAEFASNVTKLVLAP